MLGNFGATDVGWLGGDLNGNGVVGSADFGLVLGNFGFVAEPGSLSELATVPEPSSLFLVIVGVLAGCWKRRWRTGR